MIAVQEFPTKDKTMEKLQHLESKCLQETVLLYMFGKSQVLARDGKVVQALDLHREVACTA